MMMILSIKTLQQILKCSFKRYKKLKQEKLRYCTAPSKFSLETISALISMCCALFLGMLGPISRLCPYRGVMAGGHLPIPPFGYSSETFGYSSYRFGKKIFVVHMKARKFKGINQYKKGKKL